MTHTKDEWVNSVMEQAQVFASAWSLVGSRFDSGNEMENAEEQKKALRAMLSTPPAAAQPEQEPVADDIASILACRDMLDAQPVPPRILMHQATHPTNTTPPTAQRKPLTDEEIKAVIQSIDPDEKYLPKALRQFARAIEAAHGIKEKNT
jgi:hypothetical protein